MRARTRARTRARAKARAREITCRCDNDWMHCYWKFLQTNHEITAEYSMPAVANPRNAKKYVKLRFPIQFFTNGQ